MHIKRFVYGLVTLMFVLVNQAQARVIYVKTSGDDAASGNSWGEAYQTLQQALSVAMASDEIWVAAGTYKPTTGSDRTISFWMKDQVGIYGGFNGTEVARSQRNPQINVTVLSGDLGVPGDHTDNTHTVVMASGLSDLAILDGFSITDGTGSDGAGIVVMSSSSPTIVNCIFSRHRASRGGAAFIALTSNPDFKNCRFVGNNAESGAAIFTSNNSGPSFENCILSGNSASNGGGAIFHAANPAVVTLTNCIVSGNTADLGGGFYTIGKIKVVNSTIWGNIGTSIANSGVAFIFKSLETPNDEYINCIIWNNSSLFGGTAHPSQITYSVVQAAYTGVGNLSVNPQLVAPPEMGLSQGGDFRPTNCSPVVNAGLSSANLLAQDLDGNSRIANGQIDIGPYELQTISNCCPTGNVMYVDGKATGDNSGTNWTNAVKSLQDAFNRLVTCKSVTEIWVAAGSYKPTTGADRSAYFNLPAGISVYGGFLGDEVSLAQRDWVANKTVLSGDIGVSGDKNDNSFHVLVANANDAYALLDGFDIMDGNASGTGNNSIGGGMLINNNAIATFRNCNLLSNSASSGGGIYCASSSPVFINCTIAGNRASSDGGGLCADLATPEFTNCVFAGNLSEFNGGAVETSRSVPTFTNCSFSGNRAQNLGGSIFAWSANNPVLTNCIVWGNSSGIINGSGVSTQVTYSIIQGGYSGLGNLNQDPLFLIQPPIGLGLAANLRLPASSPGVNAGLNAANSSSTDLAGNARVLDGQIDLGAYELPAVQTPCIVYVDQSAKGFNTGTSWGNAFTSISQALAALTNCSTIAEIRIAKGNYTVKAGDVFSLNMSGLKVIGGYNNGGSPSPNSTVNPVVIKGDVQVLKSMRMEGISVAPL